MNTFSTTKGPTMNRFRLALLLSLVAAVAATAGCSKDAATGATEQATPAAHTVRADEQAARYVDPKVGVKTTPFSVAAPAEHPAKAHSAPAAH